MKVFNLSADEYEDISYGIQTVLISGLSTFSVSDMIILPHISERRYLLVLVLHIKRIQEYSAYSIKLLEDKDYEPIKDSEELES